MIRRLIWELLPARVRAFIVVVQLAALMGLLVLGIVCFNGTRMLIRWNADVDTTSTPTMDGHRPELGRSGRAPGAYYRPDEGDGSP